jgi:hypothetical protein
MVNNWTKDVTGRATSAEGKAYAGQLTALMSFYNKAPEATEIAVQFSNHKFLKPIRKTNNNL